ncbi:MAG: hypothetical protein HC883_03655 [Bdellovibrionaceae bacterium]|nr:hypothetical protein [Pseudobdellovibrionaceae bacterium]
MPVMGMTVGALLLWMSASAHSEIDAPMILPMGDRESLMGNAGVSISGSAGNIFYNPAGLDSLTGAKFSASGSAYAYVMGRVEAFDKSVDMNTLASVPNMLAITRRIRSWTYAFGIFSPIAIQGDIDIQHTDSNVGLNFTLNNSFRTEEQYVGIASGKDIGRGWSFGLGLFVHRYFSKSLSSFFASPAPTTAYLQKSERQQLEVLGLLPIMGVQKEVLRKVRFGMRIAAPDLKLMGRSKMHSEELQVTSGPPTMKIVREEGEGDYRLPLDVVNGLTWTPNNKHSISAELGVQFPTRFDSMPGLSFGTYYDTRLTLRQHLGYEYRFSDEYSLLAGLLRSPSSVDRSYNKADGKRLDPNNYYSATTGFYVREKSHTSGVGIFYANSKTKEGVFDLERAARSGFSVYGVILSTTINL